MNEPKQLTEQCLSASICFLIHVLMYPFYCILLLFTWQLPTTWPAEGGGPHGDTEVPPSDFLVGTGNRPDSGATGSGFKEVVALLNGLRSGSLRRKIGQFLGQKLGWKLGSFQQIFRSCFCRHFVDIQLEVCLTWSETGLNFSSQKLEPPGIWL